MKTISFAIRNMKHYLRDPGALAFSFLSVFIIIALNIFFLAEMQIENLGSILGQYPDANLIIINWILGGVICIPTVSVPLMILCYKVDDLSEKTQDDFFVTPVNRVHIILGYISAAWVLGFIMSVITLLVGEFFIVIKGGAFLSMAAFIKVILILALTNLSFSGFSFFIILFMKSKSSLTIINSILNTLIGFFVGLYVPLGMLSDQVSIIIKLFPLAQVTALLHQIMMADTIPTVFKGVSDENIIIFKRYFGIELVIGNHVLLQHEIIGILILFGILFYTGSIIAINYIKK